MEQQGCNYLPAQSSLLPPHLPASAAALADKLRLMMQISGWACLPPRYRTLACSQCKRPLTPMMAVNTNDDGSSLLRPMTNERRNMTCRYNCQFTGECLDQPVLFNGHFFCQSDWVSVRLSSLHVKLFRVSLPLIPHQTKAFIKHWIVKSRTQNFSICPVQLEHDDSNRNLYLATTWRKINERSLFTALS